MPLGRCPAQGPRAGGRAPLEPLPPGAAERVGAAPRRKVRGRGRFLAPWPDFSPVARPRRSPASPRSPSPRWPRGHVKSRVMRLNPAPQPGGQAASQQGPCPGSPPRPEHPQLFQPELLENGHAPQTLSASHTALNSAPSLLPIPRGARGSPRLHRPEPQTRGGGKGERSRRRAPAASPGAPRGSGGASAAGAGTDRWPRSRVLRSAARVRGAAARI